MLNKTTLQNIQGGADDEFYWTTTSVALWMAVGGYLDDANQVLTALWGYGLPHSRDVWLPDIAFTVLWDAAGKRPDVVPFVLQGIDAIEKNMRGRIAMDRWAYKMPDKPWAELTGQDLLRKAYLTARLVKQDPAENRDGHSIMTPAPGEEPRNMEEKLALLSKFIKSTAVEATDIFPAAATELEALAMLTKMIKEGYHSEEGLALGAELAARNGQLEVAIRFAKRCVEKAHLKPSALHLSELAASRHVAPLLLQKIVAPELGLSDQLVSEYVPELLKVLDKRGKQGRSLVYGALSWKELLQTISRHAIALDDNHDLTEEVHTTGWLGSQAATEEMITQAEIRLGVTLPTDYKAFLAVTNGFERVSVTSSVLLPVTKIDYLKNVQEPYIFDLLLDYPPDEGEREEVFQEKLRNAILLCAYPDEQAIMLVPEDPERTRWEAWFYAAWVPGFNIFPSFRHYMEGELKKVTTRYGQRLT